MLKWLGNIIELLRIGLPGRGTRYPFRLTPPTGPFDPKLWVRHENYTATACCSSPDGLTVSRYFGVKASEMRNLETGEFVRLESTPGSWTTEAKFIPSGPTHKHVVER